MKTTVMDKLSSSLGMAPLEIKEPETQQEIVPLVEEASSTPTVDPEIQSDYEFSRANTKKLIEKGMQSLDTLVMLAAASESPRTFEVLSKMMKELTEMNKDLLDIQKTRLELEATSMPPSEKEEKAQQVTNNLFVGTTSELLDMIAEKRAAKRVIEHGGQEES